MTDNQVTALVEEEFKLQRYAVTSQYLEIHAPVYVDGKLVIERIDRNGDDGDIIAYLPVEDEQFYFAIYLDAKKERVSGIATESYIRVYFTATSDSISANEFSQLTLLKPTELWNKGDLRSDGKSQHTFSRFSIEPNPEPDEFEDKLKKLLDLLEQDKEGIKKLVDIADGDIKVAITSHVSNCGGHHLSKNDIRRMNDLGLSIDFDLYSGGREFIS